MKNHSAAQSVKRSSVIQHLKTHGRIHADEKPFRCLKCEKKFRCSHNLKTHRRIYNHSKKPFSCLKCEKKFSQSQHLKIHERIHTNEKPYRCLKCEMKFSRSHNLMTHERVHTVEKPFSCSKCENKFSEGMLGRDMKEFILMKNHSAAQSVKRSSAVNTI